MSSRAYELIVGDEGGSISCYLCKESTLNTKEAWSISGAAKVTCLATVSMLLETISWTSLWVGPTVWSKSYILRMASRQ